MVKQLFLTSTINEVAADIATKIDTKGKKLAFIYTATEVEEGGKLAPWNDEDRKALVAVGFEVFDYTITGKDKEQLIHDLRPFDAIYVSGGNTFYLLQQAQMSGFIEIIRDLVLIQEKIYIGTSAGSIVAGHDTYPTFRLDNAELAPQLKGYEGFSLVNFCILPHWGSEHFRELYLNNRLEHAYTSSSVPLIALTDSQYIHIKGDVMEIVDLSRRDNQRE